jgi:type IV pilus assembly protein PilV
MHMHTRHHHDGFILIDAMIAIVLFAIGILGMITLQANAVSMASEAKYRTDAAMFADQVMAQMWGSDSATLAARFATGGPAYNTWAAAVTDDLPGAAAHPPQITVDANNLVTVSIHWSPPDEAKLGTTTPIVHNYVSTTQIAP